MRRFKSTFIFGGLVFGLVAYVFWDFTEQKLDADLEKGEVRLADFDQSKLSTLEIIRFRDSVTLELSEGRCRILLPQEESCDTELLQILLKTLNSLKGRQILEAQEIESRKSDFGFDEGVTELKWKLNSGAEGRLRIAGKNSFDGGFYVEKEDLYLADKSTGQLTNKGFAELRSKKPWSLAEDFSELSISLKGKPAEEYVLKKQEGVWITPQKTNGFELDGKKVEEWLGALRSLKGMTVFDETPAGLGTLWFSVQVGDQLLELWRRQNEVYAKSSGKDRYVMVPVERLKKVVVPLGFFYKGDVPFRFDLERATRVEFVNNGKKQVAVKEDQEWVLTEKPESFKEHRLSEFFQTLVSLDAKMTSQSWEDRDFSTKDQILIKDSQGEVIFEMKWAGVRKLKEGPFAEESLRPVMIKGQPKSLATSQYQLQNLLDIDFTTEVKSSHDSDEHVHDHHHH